MTSCYAECNHMFNFPKLCISCAAFRITSTIIGYILTIWIISTAHGKLLQRHTKYVLKWIHILIIIWTQAQRQREQKKKFGPVVRLADCVSLSDERSLYGRHSVLFRAIKKGFFSSFFFCWPHKQHHKQCARNNNNISIYLSFFFVSDHFLRSVHNEIHKIFRLKFSNSVVNVSCRAYAAVNLVEPSPISICLFCCLWSENTTQYITSSSSSSSQRQ